MNRVIRRGEGRAGAGRGRQGGATVLVALVIVALVAMLAARLIEQQDGWYRQVSLQGDRMHANMLARAGVRYAMAILADDARVSTTDHGREAWARPLPAMEAEGGVLAGRIIDLQGRINLNDAATLPAGGTARATPLARLFEALEVPADRLAALADWIDADGETRAGGAEDAYYLGLPIPSRAANQPLASVDELRYVRGFDAAIIGRLRPHVAALPAGTLLNVNTASATVMQAAVQELDSTQATALRASGDLRPFAQIDEFVARADSLGVAIVGRNGLAVTSRWFEIVGDVRWNDAFARMEAVVVREAPGAMPRVTWTSVE